MFPVFTRPRGSRKATLVSLAAAENERKASARDSALPFPDDEMTADPELSCVVPETVLVGLKRPVHSFGVVQALGGVTSVAASSAAAFADSSTSILISDVGGPCSSEGPGSLSDDDFELGRGRDFGIAGSTVTEDRVGLCIDFEATGVASPGMALEGFWVDDGVVGCVESFSSDVGRFVDGVSGRGAVVAPSSSPATAPC